MGSTQAQGMADAVRDGGADLKSALHYHLRANHYPPLPVEYVEVAVRTIEALSDDPGRIVAIPIPAMEAVGMQPREAWTDDEYETWCYATVLADVMHLWPFIESQFEDQEEED